MVPRRRNRNRSMSCEQIQSQRQSTRHAETMLLMTQYYLYASGQLCFMPDMVSLL